MCDTQKLQDEADQPLKESIVAGVPPLTVSKSERDIADTIIGNYRVVRLLGRGGIGAVYEVEHQLLKKKFALKILSPDRIPDVAIIQRFHQEAKALSGLAHRSLLRHYEFNISEQGQPYLVTDMFEGRSLSAEIEEKSKSKTELPASAIIQIMLQCAAGLAHAHERDVIHRDVKPSNIMVRDDHGTYEIKIIDFGIAKQDTADGRAPTLTSTGEIMGTPQYMSPEQCQGYKLDQRSDIYSLGCVLYQMLTGRPPFQSDNPMQTLMQHLNDPPPPTNSKDKVRLSLEAVAVKCLAKDPDFRYQTMDELIAELTAVASGANLKIKRSKKPTSTLSQRMRVYVPLALLAAVMALAAALYELWAPAVVLYTDLPFKQLIMDPDQASALMAIKESNRLRLESQLPDGNVDKAKLQLAETILVPSAVGPNPWNAEAKMRLAQTLAIEGKLDEVERICREVGAGQEIAFAHHLHSVGVAIDHGGFHRQAWPVMKRAYDEFVKTPGVPPSWKVKELWNMACASYYSGEEARALDEFKRVQPQLPATYPELVEPCRDQIALIQNAMDAGHR